MAGVANSLWPWKRTSGRRIIARSAALFILVAVAQSATAVEISSTQRTFGPEDRAWWAIQPIRKPDLPILTIPSSWPLNPIDQFILEKLQVEGLNPSPPAEKRSFIRRVYFDLLGLPPSTAAIEAFEADTSSKAHERLVDQLLSLPQYGERWARHWLDLVRYAESDGYKADDYRAYVWPYRDYVIHAFNQDKPYDQFLREQLAGDELDPANPEAIVATTFLRLWIYEYNNRDAKGQWDAILNDLTDVTGDVFLGLGMSCARCHDHKYDPILRADYYRLQAFFTPILPRDDRVVATPDQVAAHQAQLAVWESQTRVLREQIQAIEEPYRHKAAKDATEKFPEDIQALLGKPPGERTPYEVQIADLAYRQIQYEFDHLDAKIKSDDKPELAALRKQLAAFDSLKPDPLQPAFTVTDVGPVAPPTYIPQSQDRQPIPPGFLTILDPAPAKILPAPKAPTSTGRRATLARWLTDPQNPLTSRVIVNRLWQYHFGRGLASSTSDLGKLGAPPSHPELLDWLASTFVAEGWSLKQLHRLMLTSATYRQSATATPQEQALLKDPDNRWLWRMPIRRLDAEQIRDSLLAATGELLPDIGGPSVDPSQPRRAIYTKTKRNTHDPLLEAFDQPDGINSMPQRNITTTPTQTLLLFNGPFVHQRSKALATHATHLDPNHTQNQIASAFQLVFSRKPESWELDGLEQFLAAQTERIRHTRRSAQPPPVPAEPATSVPSPAGNLEPPAAGGPPNPVPILNPQAAAPKLADSGASPERLAFEDLCHVLLNANEFLYVD